MNDEERPKPPLSYATPATPKLSRITGEAILCLTFAAVVLALFVRFGVYPWLFESR